MRVSKFAMGFVLAFLVFAPQPGQGTATFSADLSVKLRQRRDDNSSNPSDFHFLVTGGYRPEKNELVKYVVSLRLAKPVKYFGDNHFCGGAIMSKRAILTAAHCLFDGGVKKQARYVRIVAGTPKRLTEEATTQERRVRKLMPHPNYRVNAFGYDIAIVLLKEELETGDAVAVIALINKSPTAGTHCTVVGWGTVVQFGPLPDEAINGDVEILESEKCSSIAVFNENGMLCAKNAEDSEVDSCQGDSGGPLICGNMATGIVSFGNGCGEMNSAGVYTDVFHYRHWIQENSGPRRQRRPLVMLGLLLALLLAA